MTDRLKAFVNQNADTLLDKNGVQSVGVGQDDDGNPVVVVGVDSKASMSVQEEEEIASFFPQNINHTVEEVGVYEAELLKAQADFRGKHRPVVQGPSCGHPDVTAGTLGYMFETDDGKKYVGSNNHVLADVNEASVGDAQLQPGTADGGSVSNDQFGTLAYYTPIEDGVNVDLAIAEASVGIENTVLGISKPVVGAASSVSVGDTVKKAGRTTQVTTGQVQQVGASVDVGYGNAGTFRITDCFITSDMSDGGDSGSATWKESSDGLRAAGRLFAGSSSATVHHTYENELAVLQSEFDSSITLLTDGGGGGDKPTASVELTLVKEAPEEGNIRATVRDDGGNRLSGATVTISGEASGSKTTGSQGRATFKNVPIGSYTVEAMMQGYQSDSVSVGQADFQ